MSSLRVLRSAHPVATRRIVSDTPNSVKRDCRFNLRRCILPNRYHTPERRRDPGYAGHATRNPNGRGSWAAGEGRSRRPADRLIRRRARRRPSIAIFNRTRRSQGADHRQWCPAAVIRFRTIVAIESSPEPPDRPRAFSDLVRSSGFGGLKKNRGAPPIRVTELLSRPAVLLGGTCRCMCACLLAMPKTRTGLSAGTARMGQARERAMPHRPELELPPPFPYCVERSNPAARRQLRPPRRQMLPSRRLSAPNNSDLRQHGNTCSPR